ncbi:hypothetical protein CGC21_3425 [Leishmania donovani]|uniref:Uncharacterized protein n=1 Tax=Leishmania donovani TaxID=5661 RepID=A0A504Y1W0_LEIDO|nr:hypothetical protein CGC21_3425 [Leishmania donovani]
MENGVPRTRKLRHPKRYSARYASAPSSFLLCTRSTLSASNGVGDLAKASPWVRDHRCEEFPERLRCCPGLEEQHRHGIADASAAKVAFAASPSMLLCEPFGLPDPFLPPPEEASDPSLSAVGANRPKKKTSRMGRRTATDGASLRQRSQ